MTSQNIGNPMFCTAERSQHITIVLAVTEIGVVLTPIEKGGFEEFSGKGLLRGVGRIRKTALTP